PTSAPFNELVTTPVSAACVCRTTLGSGRELANAPSTVLRIRRQDSERAGEKMKRPAETASVQTADRSPTYHCQWGSCHWAGAVCPFRSGPCSRSQRILGKWSNACPTLVKKKNRRTTFQRDRGFNMLP